MAELFRDLATARADGTIGQLLLKLARVDVLLLDDFAMAPMKDHERRDFLEICDDRYQRRSTILTSQLPVANWHEQIGDPSIADSIMDRLVHNAYRIELNGESMRNSADENRSKILNDPLQHATEIIRMVRGRRRSAASGNVVIRRRVQAVRLVVPPRGA